MGTSASSKGPNAGVSFDPPWLDEVGGFEQNLPAGQPSEESDDTPEVATDSSADGATNVFKKDGVVADNADSTLAPAARFGGARTKFRKYACEQTGRAGFEKAAGYYSKKGMGGAYKLARRMRHSTATGALFAEFLNATSSLTTSGATAWVKEIVDRGLKGQELIDAIIQQVAPSSGSKDEESVTDSMARALSDFLLENEDSDLLALGTSEIREITESYLANEACYRLANDIGQFLESGMISLKESLTLLNEMREYLRADLSVQIESLWKATANPTPLQLNFILRKAIQRTFEVYEGEI